MRTLSTFLSLAAALNTGLIAQKVAEVEPNDTAATAMPITAGMHITASYASATDEDWFSFSLNAPGQVHLHTVATGTLSLGTSRDNRIAFYDATGTTRLAWNDSAVGTMADCGVTLPAGSYTARVNLKTGAIGTYDLDFYALPVRPIDAVEAPEPNGATGTPSAFTLGNTVEGTIQTGAIPDEDFWSFTLAARAIVLAATSDDGGVPQLDNLALRFYSGTPGAWTAIGVGDVTNSQSHRVTNLVHPGLLQAGSYAISVKGGPAAVGTAPWDFAKTGKYSLRTALIELPDANIVVEAPEPNNTPATAASMLSPGDAAIGNCTGSLDDDWYMLAVGGPVTIGAMAEGVGSAPLAGSNLKLWDANGTTLLTSASGSATLHGKLVYTLERAGIYYLSINGPTVAVTGDYRLHVGGCTPLFVSASTRMEPASTNACIGSTGVRPLIGNMQGETPAFGSTFITRIERTIPSSFAVGMIGLSNTLASGSIPLPYLLGYGGLDSQSQPTPCFVRVDPVLMIAVLTDASGAGEYSMNFSYSPVALGLKIFQQALCYDPSLNSLGFSVSNDASYVLGDRPF